VIAWFAGVALGRVPAGLHGFIALLTARYPSLSGIG
jgi:hypothetical protein